MPREKVILEITETAMMEDIDFAVARLHELKAQEIRLAVDDFGSGYSSLNYIRKLPVDILKIDRSFVADVAKPGELSSLTQTIVELASILKMVPVAEGIEDEGQLRALQQMGCALGQGFLFTRPLDVRALETVVLNDVSRRLAA